MKINGILIAASLFGCATSKTAKIEEPSTQSGHISGDIVVIQTKAKAPIISDKTASHWVSLSQSKDNDLARMQGLLATGSWREATEAAKLDLLKHPNNPEAMMGLASAHVLGGNFEMAGYYADQVLRTQPSNSDALNIIGLRTMMASDNHRADYQEAISWFQKSVDADGTQIAAALNMGHLQLEIGSAADAANSFHTAATRCGNCEKAVLGAGIASARSGKFDDAKSLFESLISKNSADAVSKYELAIVYKNGYHENGKASALLQEIVSDPVGAYANAAGVKRLANIALRRIKANDRSGPGVVVSGDNESAPVKTNPVPQAEGDEAPASQ